MFLWSVTWLYFLQFNSQYINAMDSIFVFYDKLFLIEN